MNKKIVITGFLSALGELAYIVLVATLMFIVGKLFGENPDPAIVAPVAFLLLFVISAAASGALILGRPIMLYFEGKKEDALKLFGATLGWLVLFLFIAFGLVALQ